MSGFKTIDEIERDFGSLQGLRRELNELAEDYVPGIYADGDVRTIPKIIYRRMVSMLNDLSALEERLLGKVKFENSRPAFIGSHGTLYFQEGE